MNKIVCFDNNKYAKHVVYVRLTDYEMNQISKEAKKMGISINLFCKKAVILLIADLRNSHDNTV